MTVQNYQAINHTCDWPECKEVIHTGADVQSSSYCEGRLMIPSLPEEWTMTVHGVEKKHYCPFHGGIIMKRIEQLLSKHVKL